MLLQKVQSITAAGSTIQDALRPLFTVMEPLTVFIRSLRPLLFSLLLPRVPFIFRLSTLPLITIGMFDDINLDRIKIAPAFDGDDFDFRSRCFFGAHIAVDAFDFQRFAVASAPLPAEFIAILRRGQDRKYEMALHHHR